MGKAERIRNFSRTATYQDVLDAPPHMVAEIVAGTLHTQPRPTKRHAWASSRLGGRLDGPFNSGDGGPGGWLIIDEPELHLGEDIVVPDIAGWRLETMTEDMEGAYFEQAPDWVWRGALAIDPKSLTRVQSVSPMPGRRYHISGSWMPMPRRSRRSNCARGCGSCWPR